MFINVNTCAMNYHQNYSNRQLIVLKKINSHFSTPKTLQAPAEVRNRQQRQMQTGIGSFHPLFCNHWTTYPFHCCCSPTSDIGSIIRGSEKNPATFTLRPGLTRQKVTLRRAAVKEKEPMLLSTISAALASTSASNCEAEHTAVTLQERNTFFNLSFYTK